MKGSSYSTVCQFYQTSSMMWAKFFKTTANFYSELLKFGTCMAMIQREVSMIACI